MSLVKNFVVTVTPTITAGAYHANDQVGGVMTFARVMDPATLGGFISAVRIEDAARQAAQLYLAIFKASPTMANADNGAWSITSANSATAGLIAVVTINTGDYVTIGSSAGVSHATKSVWIPFVGTTTSLYGVLGTPSTPTYAAVSDLKVTLCTTNQSN